MVRAEHGALSGRARVRAGWRCAQAALVWLGVAAGAAWAQPDPSGIDFVTVGAAGNPVYDGPDVNQSLRGRGSVAYEYRIGRTEVTTAQWVEFYNAFYDRAPHVNLPVRWGGVDLGPGQSPRFIVSSAPNAAMFPVSGPTWRTSAMFCNWLHNDKGTDLSAVMDGAYDVSTFGYIGSVFTDQAAHHPDARYWIPTVDEWIKAGFYDPDYGGAGVGGWWWNTPAGTNVPLIHAPPGTGQSNSAFDLPGDAQFRIPLGSYPDVLSPWGLLDMAGATSEFSETVRTVDGIHTRRVMNSHWGSSDVGVDSVYGMGTEFPSLPSLFYGLRVAASVPAPGSWLPIGVACVALSCRRVRSGSQRGAR